MMTEWSCVGDKYENIMEENYSAPMPWIGLYIAAASLLCTIAMAADIFHGFRHRKLWFPCKYFTLNAASLTMIAIAMKLAVDLSTSMPGTNNQLAKVNSTGFMCTMMANFMPSLGPMTAKDLVMNVTALSILVITIAVNLCIQIFTEVIADYTKTQHLIFVVFMLYLLIAIGSLALTIPFSKKILEHKYHELHKLASKEESEQTGKQSCTVDHLVQDVTKYSIMAETSSPQFVMACSPTCSASGVICMFLAIWNIPFLDFKRRVRVNSSDYKWSVVLILVTQAVGVAVGSVAPIFRLFSALSLKLSLKWSNNCLLRVYEVETYWTQILVDWKSSRIPFRIGGLNFQKRVHDIRNIILEFWIIFQILVVIICKIVRLIPILLVIMFLYCWYGCKWLERKLAGKADSPNNHEGSKSESGLGDYVLQLQDEMELGDRTILITSISEAVNRLIHKAEKQQPKNLLRLLEKSTGFKGVGEFDSDQVPPLYPEQPPNCWSLVVVTLTSIAISLPHIKGNNVDQLLAGVSEALLYVNLVEEITDGTKGDSVNRKWVANNFWLEVELYGKWMENDLRKMAQKGKTSAETLWLLGDKAKNIITGIDKAGMNGGIQDKSRYKFIVANSMYRISQTILLDQNGREGHTEEMLFEQLSVMISDILGACLTNLPQVIRSKFQANEIEEQEKSVKTAARLIGQTKEVLKILQRRELPSLDHDQLGYIDEWHAYFNLRNPSNFISSSNNETDSSSSSHSLVIDVE